MPGWMTRGRFCHKSLALRALDELGGTRFEQTAFTPPRTPISETRGTKSGTPNAENTPSDPDLALIQERWPKLPEHIRQAVLALVRSASDKEQSL